MRGNWIVVVIAIGAAIWWAQQRDREPSAAPTGGSSTRPPTAVEYESPPPVFRCEGKTRCAEMKSCEEATYYLQHCPGVKLDGDHDGVPCEDQYCR
jgi:hypothetical protein